MKKYPLLVSALTLVLAFTAGCGNNLTETTDKTGASQISEVREDLFLEITGPADEAQVSTPTVVVSGRTLSDAVVSINGNIKDVDTEGIFTGQVTLDIGPNVIEVVASNFYGDEKSAILSVIYIP